jgi:hypothetical protein
VDVRTVHPPAPAQHRGQARLRLVVMRPQWRLCRARAFVAGPCDGVERGALALTTERGQSQSMRPAWPASRGSGWRRRRREAVGGARQSRRGRYRWATGSTRAANWRARVVAPTSASESSPTGRDCRSRRSPPMRRTSATSLRVGSTRSCGWGAAAGRRRRPGRGGSGLSGRRGAGQRGAPVPGAPGRAAARPAPGACVQLSTSGATSRGRVAPPPCRARPAPHPRRAAARHRPPDGARAGAADPRARREAAG